MNWAKRCCSTVVLMAVHEYLISYHISVEPWKTTIHVTDFMNCYYNCTDFIIHGVKISKGVEEIHVLYIKIFPSYSHSKCCHDVIKGMLNGLSVVLIPLPV